MCPFIKSMVLRIKKKPQTGNKMQSNSPWPQKTVSLKLPTNSTTKFFQMLRNLGLLLCNDKAPNKPKVKIDQNTHYIIRDII